MLFCFLWVVVVHVEDLVENIHIVSRARFPMIIAPAT